MSEASAAVASGVYLRSYLAPLAALLERADVTDLFVNRPGEIWAETIGGAIERHEAPALDEATLARLARQIAALSHQGISREHPLLAASLPGGTRVQIVAPPATRGGVALALRKHVASALSLGDYVASGALADTATRTGLAQGDGRDALAERLASGDIAGTLADAVRRRMTILISGGTSSGKTTFLNALLNEVPAEERLILIEDTPELALRHANGIGLIAARSALGEAQVDANQLVAASLRMRPDRIILGELRGDEAFAFLRAINTGHPGSMATIHANSARTAVEQLSLLVLQAGTSLGRDDILHHVRQTIDVFVHLERVNGRRRVAEVVLNDKS